jgi:uncharacterized small protein (TIGR04563 family)
MSTRVFRQKYYCGRQSIYLAGALEEVRAEAARLERSVSWVLQRAWMMARDTIRTIPGGRGGDSALRLVHTASADETQASGGES